VRRHDLARPAAVTDAETRRTTALVRGTSDLGPVATQRFRNLTGALSLLPYARGRAAAGADGTEVVIAYNSVAGAVLAFDRALVGVPDEQLTSARSRSTSCSPPASRSPSSRRPGSRHCARAPSARPTAR
jgi:hypothetical protein